MKKGFVWALLSLLLFTLTVEAGRWETNYEKARGKALVEGKFLLLDFTGSDWCGWCIKLDKEVFSKSAFKKYADENFVCVEVDFPRGRKLSSKLTKQNRALADKYGVKGFPSIVILTPEGQRVAKTGYQKGGADNYVEHLESLILPHRDLVKKPADIHEEVSTGPRTWTSTSGATLEGILVKDSNGWIELKKADGTPLRIHVTNLSQKDRQYLVSLK